MRDIAIYGAGGFGKEVACIINRINRDYDVWKLIGFFDDGMKRKTRVSHYGEVLGNINDLNHWASPVNIVFAIGNPLIIKNLVRRIDNPKVDFRI